MRSLAASKFRQSSCRIHCHPPIVSHLKKAGRAARSQPFFPLLLSCPYQSNNIQSTRLESNLEFSCSTSAKNTQTTLSPCHGFTPSTNFYQRDGAKALSSLVLPLPTKSTIHVNGVISLF